ncbi:hypothetical protein [Streptomyces albicerus]|jgi:hypothetical protein|uniref:hypothetical protein n=1 Tax=Streptomyces albicerus TaxID=2569859 RepID=UPI00124B9953|nr:hypothetical protein [Streptomyces albicerus]
MTDPAGDRELAPYIQALCVLLGAERELRDLPDVPEAAARAKSLVVAGADTEELRTAFRKLEDALRAAGDARGLLGRSRGYPGQQAPGVSTQIRVAVCPGPVRCTRMEPARDLWPAPLCAIGEQRMRKVRLRPGP